MKEPNLIALKNFMLKLTNLASFLAWSSLEPSAAVILGPAGSL